MKKSVFIAVCMLFVVSLSSCRSTSRSCGLAETPTTAPITVQVQEVVAS